MHSYTSNFKLIFKLLYLASFILLFFWIGYRVIHLQKGYPVPGHPTEPWISNTARMRDILYKEDSKNSKKIFIVSGSNSLFGISSNILSERTGYQVRNYALHAGLNIDLLFSQINEKVREGDIVVAPLEWEMRTRIKYNSFDYENYLHHFSKSVVLSPLDNYKILSSVPLERWLLGIKNYIYLPKDSVRYWDFYTEESLKYTWELREKNVNYSHMALTEHGDININLPMTSRDWEDGSIFNIPETSNENEEKWVNKLEKWNDFFEKKGARLFLTYPVLLEGKENKILSPDVWSKISYIRDSMEKTKTPLHCDPISSVFSNIYRYDTSYHMNSEGAKLRTIELSECLNDFINSKDTKTKKIDYKEAIYKVRNRLDKQRENFGSGNMPFQIKLRELKKINDALNKFYSEKSNYPKSLDDKKFTNSLDFKIKSNDEIKIHYSSDGKSYKLIIESSQEECAVISANWPELIYNLNLKSNEIANCSGFGYWSKI